MNKEIIIALCAGEASGDLLGAHLIQAIKQQYPHSRFIGIGGPRMKAAGLSSLHEQDPLAVRGYVEVLGNLREILRIRRELIDDLKRISPHVFIGIDAPNFNLPVAAKLKAAGIPTLQYVSPSVWAWKPERVHKIVKQVNQVLCLFPMEPKLYREAGGRAEYVGHPLAQILPMENSKVAVRERLKLGLTTPVFTLLPGSRISEVEFMAPIFLRTAALILQSLPEAVFLMPYPSAPVRERLQAYLQREEFRHLPIRLQAAKTELACMAADVVLVTSGTATLEVALCKRPMVISYKISGFTYWLVRRKIKIPYVGLPNILLGKEVVPELLQDNATPEKLAHAMLDWYYHPVRVEALETQFQQLHQRLLRNTDELAAYVVLSEAGVQLPKPEVMGADEEEELPNATKMGNQTVEAKNEEDVQAVESVETTDATQVEAVAQKDEQDDVVEMSTAEIASPIKPELPASDTAIPKPDAIIMHHNRVATVQEVPEPKPAPIESTPMNIQSPSNKQSKTIRKSGGLFGWLKSLFGGRQDDDHSPSSVAEEGESVVSESKPLADGDAEIVAVSRAESDDDVVRKPAVAQPMVAVKQPVSASQHQASQTAQVATPSIVVNTATPTVRHVIEEEELHEAKIGIAMPKSTVLAQNNKPNIFTKYQTQDGQTPAVETQTAPEQSAKPKIQITATVQKSAQTVGEADNSPSIQIKQPTVQVQTPRIQVSAPTVQSHATASPTATPAVSVTEVKVVEKAVEKVETQAEPIPQPQSQSAVSSLPKGTLANYINRASMAWLPDSVKAPVQSTAPSSAKEQESVELEVVSMPPVVNASVVAEPKAVNEEINLEVVHAPTLAEDISLEVVSEPAVVEPVAEPSVTTMVDEEISLTVEAKPTPITQNVELDIAEIATVSTNVVNVEAEAPAVVTVVPPSIIVSEPSVVPKITVTEQTVESQVAPTVIEVEAEASQPTVAEAISVVEQPIVMETAIAELEVEAKVEAVAPTVIDISQPKAVSSQPSFANVFRRHTLSNDRADAEDDKAENEHNEEETEAPAQIVVERTVEMMAQEPTQVSNTKDMAEEATEAPSVPRYSANPKRYNNGIFY